MNGLLQFWVIDFVEEIELGVGWRWLIIWPVCSCWKLMTSEGPLGDFSWALALVLLGC